MKGVRAPLQRRKLAATVERAAVGGNMTDPEGASRFAAPAEFLAAMANEKRLLALMVLAEGEISVSDLAARVGLSKSALSQHLGIMRESGLITPRQDRQRVYYLCTGPALKVIKLIARLVERETLPGSNLNHPPDP